MTARISELELALGSNEMVVEETERMQRQLKEVEALFSPNQAQVYRAGNDMIIRLIGLSFPTGQAVIETKYFGVLRQLQDALRVFPDYPVIVEGHTDSIGSDVSNMALSQQRADAVREYLIANQGLPYAQVKAVGYGKLRPIADNETAEGRARNRRIDIVIKGAVKRSGGI
jgi:outer membrane protein OmpA-like peptidoglycan-associated protein